MFQCGDVLEVEQDTKTHKKDLMCVESRVKEKQMIKVGGPKSSWSVRLMKTHVSQDPGEAPKHV